MVVPLDQKYCGCAQSIGTRAMKKRKVHACEVATVEVAARAIMRDPGTAEL
jgi:hypothetical protein